MCAGALVAARVGRLVLGALDPKAGAAGSLYNLLCDPRLNHEVPVDLRGARGRVRRGAPGVLRRAALTRGLRAVPP